MASRTMVDVPSLSSSPDSNPAITLSGVVRDLGIGRTAGGGDVVGVRDGEGINSGPTKPGVLLGVLLRAAGTRAGVVYSLSPTCGGTSYVTGSE